MLVTYKRRRILTAHGHDTVFDDSDFTDRNVIAQTKIHEVFDTEVQFELFREDHKPPLEDLCAGLLVHC